MIPKETIDRVLNAALIEEVIGEFVQLKRAGSNLKGLSPFTNERTPSFVVSPSKQIFKDFSSGKGGNVLNFIMEHEKLTYVEAIRWLAKKYNIEIEEKNDPEEIAARSERESLMVILQFAEKYFTEQLHQSDEGRAIGLSYFKERGFSDQTIETFKLGYSLEQWDALTKHAHEKGHKAEKLEKLGLLKTKDNRTYDVYRGRVIFPIHNISGRTIGFGARTLKLEKTVPKYINSPESEVYDKSNVLYGLHLAKNEIRKRDNCYLVEGYTDVISLHQAGVENVVSSSGTSLTEGQIRLIKRHTQNVTILYDGDSAGIRASFRGIDMLLQQGLNVRVVLFPDGDDPDSFARKSSKTELEDFLSREQKDFIRFKTDVLLAETQNDPIRKAGLIKDIVTSISVIPDMIMRSVFIKECAQMMEIQEQTLQNELNKLLRKKVTERLNQGGDKADNKPTETPLADDTAAAPPAQSLPQTPPAYYQERDLLRLVFSYGTEDLYFEVNNEDGHLQQVAYNLAAYIVADLQHDELFFDDALHQKCYHAIVAQLQEQEQFDPQYFVNHEDMEIQSFVADVITEKYHLHNWTKANISVVHEKSKLRQAVTEALLAFKSYKIQVLKAKIDKALSQISAGSDYEEEMTRIHNMLKIRTKISRSLGRVILK